MLQKIYDSSLYSNLMQHKGFDSITRAMDVLRKDVDENGVPTMPGKWGVTIDDAESRGGDDAPKASDKAGRNLGTVDEEAAFWESVRRSDFKVPTDTRLSPVAGRWNTAKNNDPELAARYNAITGEKKCQKRDASRREWAQGKYNTVMDARRATKMRRARMMARRMMGIERM